MAESRRRRRWPWVLSGLALLLAIGAWYVNRQLEPNRLTAIVLQQAGESLQLKLRFQGQPDYALKPEPRLLIPNFSVSGLDGKVFLFARNAEISLPWSTITGEEPVITRIELDRPRIEVPGLRRWIASRPPTPFKLPTLTKGLEISGGTVSDDSYTISKLNLQLPRLKTGEPAKATASGRFTQGATVVDFKLALGMKTPGLDSEFDLQGNGMLQQSPEPQKFQLQLAGHFLSDDKVFSIEARTLRFDGASPLPRLEGAGKFELAENMTVNFDGLLLDWPKAWPALPEPLATNTRNLPVKISYVGKPDLSDPLSLVVAREPTTLQAALRTEQLRDWMAATGGSPLPPLNGTLRTPSMKFDGVELQGVEIEISDGETAGVLPP